jgi:hypothetical protein
MSGKKPAGGDGASEPSKGSKDSKQDSKQVSAKCRQLLGSCTAHVAHLQLSLSQGRDVPSWMLKIFQGLFLATKEEEPAPVQSENQASASRAQAEAQPEPPLSPPGSTGGLQRVAALIKGACLQHSCTPAALAFASCPAPAPLPPPTRLAPPTMQRVPPRGSLSCVGRACQCRLAFQTFGGSLPACRGHGRHA